MKLKTNHIKILADQLTPVLIFERIRKKYTCSTLLESFDFKSGRNSYSYIGFDRIGYIQGKKDIIKIKLPYKNESIPYPENKTIGSLLSELSNELKTAKFDYPFSTSGLLGYLSYELLLRNQKINYQSCEFPEFFYQLYKYFLVFDHFTDEIYLFEHLKENETSNLNNILHQIKNGIIISEKFNLEGEEQSETKDEEFIQKVNEAKDHCQRGNVFQLVLSRKFEQSFSGDDFKVYRHLRKINPSPYLFYFDFGNFKLFGSSPETQLQVIGNKATLNPIAGTYRKTINKELNLQLKKQLQSDKKELSEHVMLVDLARNDLNSLGKGAVVKRFCELEEFSHVFHLVSEIETEIKPETNPIELLLESCPAGTLSGAPKNKAMQLIDQMENSPREYYGGCIGIIDSEKNIQKAITIRTFKSSNNVLSYRAGAGVTINSDPTSECMEINHKLSALRQAITEATKNEL